MMISIKRSKIIINILLILFCIICISCQKSDIPSFIIEDNEPPEIIAGPRLKRLTDNYVTIEWETNEESNSIIKYGNPEGLDGDNVNINDLGFKIENSDLVTYHEIMIDNLIHGEKYYYTVESIDKFGNKPDESILPINTMYPFFESDTILIADFLNDRIIAIDKNNNNIIWEYTCNKPLSIFFIHYGALLLTQDNNIEIITPQKELLWNFTAEDHVAPEGFPSPWVPQDAVMSNDEKYIFYCDALFGITKIDYETKKFNDYLYPETTIVDIDIVDNSNLLLSLYSEVKEIDNLTNILFKYTELNQAWDVDKKNNGNYLIADSNSHRVIEVNQECDIIWQYGQTGIPGSNINQLNYPMDVEELNNENILITDSHNHRIIEVDYDKNIIWQYGNTGNSGSSAGYLNSPKDAYEIY